MASKGRIYQRGHIYYVAYRWDGREYRQSARSSDRAVAERLLARRVRECAESGPTGGVTFDTLATAYLDDYVLRRLRTLDTARGRVANLRAVFGGWVVTAMTTESVRDYQRTRRAAGAAAATVNRETSALSRMFYLGVRAGRLPRVGLCLFLGLAETGDSRPPVGRGRRTRRCRTVVARAVEDPGRTCLADLDADRGGAGTAARDTSTGRTAGLHTR